MAPQRRHFGQEAGQQLPARPALLIQPRVGRDARHGSALLAPQDIQWICINTSVTRGQNDDQGLWRTLLGCGASASSLCLMRWGVMGIHKAAKNWMKSMLWHKLPLLMQRPATWPWPRSGVDVNHAWTTKYTQGALHVMCHDAP